jgi:hypothetical protein
VALHTNGLSSFQGAWKCRNLDAEDKETESDESREHGELIVGEVFFDEDF